MTRSARHGSAVSIAVLALCAWAAGPAQADVIYNFTPLITTGSAGQAILPLSFVLTLDDGFAPESLSRNCDIAGCASTGNFSDFSLAAYYGKSLLGTLNATPDGAFEDTHGSIAGGSGSLTWNTSMNSILLTFGNGVWNAAFNSDFLMSQCSQTGCTASGTLATAVPEPPTVGVFVAGWLCLAAARRRLKAR